MKCILCDKSVFKVIGKKQNYDILMCINCTLTKLDPTPTEKELINFYKNDYREIFSQQKFVTEKAIENEKNRSTDIINFLDNDLQIYSILDIGSSTGTLIEIMTSKYDIQKSYGIEFNDIYAEYSRKKLPNTIIFQKPLNEIPFQDKIDFISLVHVLEHTSNPKELLTQIKDRLSKSGFFYVEVPNLKTPYLDLFKDYFQIYHTYYFTDNTLSNILDKTGFEVIKLNYVNNLSVGALCRVKSNNNSEINYFDNASEILLKLKIYRVKYFFKKILIILGFKRMRNFINAFFD